MSDIAIYTEQISKRFQIGARRKGYTTLREQINSTLSAPWRRLASVVRGGSADAPENSFWALKDVSFEVNEGDVVGVIGRNGSGKSTLLKILARITEPTEGSAEIHGRVASLLEVGTGFHPELTGRENIFLNGAILGMARTEIERKFDEIVSFSEVEKFIDTPVKHFSTGMYLRLAFAVAAHLEPEILLVDEVLAVGDAAFQRKCLGKMGEVAKEGRTVFLVSHNMAAITRLSNKVLWLNSGRLEAYGDPETIVTDYLASGVKESGEVLFNGDSELAQGSDYVRVLAARIKNRDGVVSCTLDSQLPFAIEMEYEILKPARNLRVGITLSTQDSTVILSSKDADAFENGLDRSPGKYLTRCTIPGDFLNNGQYFVTIGSDTPMIQTHFRFERLLGFHIEQTGQDNGHIPDRRAGFVRMQFPWDVQRMDNGSSLRPVAEFQDRRPN